MNHRIIIILWMWMMIIMLQVSDCMDCTGCWSRIRRKRRQERILEQLHEPFGAFPPTPRPTTLRPTSPPTRQKSYAQKVIDEYCPSGTIHCRLDNHNLQNIQNVIFPSSIQQLTLSRNYIKTLIDVQFPISLTYLSLQQNKIQFNEQELVNLSYLRSLEILLLDYNRITSLTGMLLPRSLKELSLRNNQFASISLGANVDRLNQLNRLDLGLNHLQTLSGNLTNKLPKQLQTLKVDMNQIQSVEHVTLPSRLQRLDLRNNPLQAFDVINIKQLFSVGINVQFEGTKIISNQLKTKIRQIPTAIWDSRKTNVTRECQICCEPILDGDVIRTLPCLHQYHCKCVDKWLAIHGTCPECRHPIDQNDLPPEAYQGRSSSPPIRAIRTPGSRPLVQQLNYL